MGFRLVPKLVPWMTLNGVTPSLGVIPREYRRGW